MADTVLIMAGGTGGHVFPALAVAEELLRRGVEVHWLGTARGIEADLVPRTGIPLHCIAVSGLRGKRWRTLLGAPVQLVRALIEAVQVIRQVRPVCVLGLGGFASGPGGLAAWLLRKPLVIHEQNAVAGTTNRLLALFARRILLGYPDALESDHTVVVGNPVRAEIAQLPPPAARWQQRTGPLRLLVLGGSLGARPINEVVPAAIAELPAALRPEIWHQTGRGHDASVAQAYAAHGIEARVAPFIDAMSEAYAWADVALCRAGALTVAELAAAGLGALLVPLPHAIDDHQRHNALWLVAQGGARLLPQAELTATGLAQLLNDLTTKPQQLLGWATAARAVAKPDAAHVVADHCLEVAHAVAA